MASGIEVQTTITLFQFPKNRRMSSDTKNEEIKASRTTLLIAAFTKTD
jgi:hypothetical protein